MVPALARVKQDLLQDLDGNGLRERIGDDRIFPTLPTAVAAFRAGEPGQLTRSRHGGRHISRTDVGIPEHEGRVTGSDTQEGEDLS